MTTTPLLRERTDVSSFVRNLPRPPVPDVPAPFSFRVANPDVDAAMVSEWMHRPHLVSTWRSDWPPSDWHDYLGAQLSGTYSLPLIGSRAGEPYSYVEIYRASRDVMSTAYVSDPYDIGFHGAMAHPEETGKGMVREYMPPILASIFDLEPHCRRIMFDPEYHLDMVRSLLELFGCVLLGERSMPDNRRVAIYALARTARDVPTVTSNR